MSDYGNFKIDIPQAKQLKSDLSAETLKVSEASQKAQAAMEANNTDDPIMKTIGQIGQLYGQFASKMKGFQQKADSELDSSINQYQSALKESDQLLKEAESRYHSF